jgi:hypothetical protein
MTTTIKYINTMRGIALFCFLILSLAASSQRQRTVMIPTDSLPVSGDIIQRKDGKWLPRSISEFYNDLADSVSNVRAPMGYIDITTLGAIGNGLFDNTALFEQIFATAGNYYIPEGVFIVSYDSLSTKNGSAAADRGIVVASNTRIRGAGMYKSIIKQTGVNNTDITGSTLYSVFNCTNKNNCEFTDFAIEGENLLGQDLVDNSTGEESKGIFFWQGSKNNIVERCRFDYIWGHGVVDFTSPIYGGGYTTVRNCRATYNSKNGFNMNGDYLVFTGNYGAYNGFTLIEASTSYAIIAHNTALYNRTRGMAIGGFVSSSEASTRGWGNRIHGNYCAFNALEGIGLNDGTKYADVSGNTCIQNNIGIQVTGTINPAVGNSIHDNIIVSNGGTATSPIGIYVTQPDTRVYNNKIINTGITGYEQKFGILLGATISGVKIWGNDVSGHTLNDYYFNNSVTDGYFDHSLNPSATVRLGTSNTFTHYSGGSGSPEGVIAAPVGAVYRRTNGGASTTLYVKESGSGNTGWVAK